MKQWALALGVAAMIASAPAAAWNARGHMIVAAIAWNKLTPAKQRRVSALIQLNPLYHEWIAGVPADQRDMVAFVRAATWPDIIRNRPGYVDDGITPPPGPDASRNIGYSDMLLHRYWHFRDEPFSPDGTPLEPPESPNAETQIVAFTAALGDPTVSENIRSYDLVWLMHLVGDVHQPLHATSRFTAATPHGDAGGNSITVCDPTCGTKLHSFWDGALGNSASAQSAIAAVDHPPSGRLPIPPAPAAKAQIADPHVWLVESFGLARARVYRAPIRQGRGNYHITQRYRTLAGATATQRVALAGARLANLINSTDF